MVTRLCAEHVLVTEWVDGMGFEDVKAMDRDVRDRFGEIVFRFFFGSLYRTGHFSGDPHPGNYRLMPDGRVAFIDFGMTKRVATGDIDGRGGGGAARHGGRRRRAPRASSARWASSTPRTRGRRPRRCSSTSAT